MYEIKGEFYLTVQVLRHTLAIITIKGDIISSVKRTVKLRFDTFYIFNWGSPFFREPFLKMFKLVFLNISVLISDLYTLLPNKFILKWINSSDLIINY